MRNAIAPPTERNLLNKGAKGNALNAEVRTASANGWVPVTHSYPAESQTFVPFGSYLLTNSG